MSQIKKYLKARKIFFGLGKKKYLRYIKHNFPYEYSKFIDVTPPKGVFNLLGYFGFRTTYDIREIIGGLIYQGKLNIKKNNYVFFVNSMSHSKIAIPLFKQIKNSIIVANGYSTKKFLQKENIPYVSLDYFHKYQICIKFSLNPKTAILDSLLMRAKNYYQAIDNTLNELQPKKVIFFNEVDMFGKIIVKLAKKKDIKCIYIQHGLMLEHPSYDKMLADKILVWGNTVKKYLVSVGNDQDKIILTGNPLYDKLTSGKSKKSNEDLVITYTSQVPGFEISKEMNKTIFENLVKIKNARVIIKLHPAEHILLNGFPIFEYIKNKIQGSKIIITKKTSIIDLINASDAIVTQLSTTGVEAILLDKKVISINLSGKKSIAPYVKEKAAYEITKKKDILKIPEIIQNKALWKGIKKRAQNFKFQYNYKNDGKAKERIIKQILE